MTWSPWRFIRAHRGVCVVVCSLMLLALGVGMSFIALLAVRRLREPVAVVGLVIALVVGWSFVRFGRRTVPVLQLEPMAALGLTTLFAAIFATLLAMDSGIRTVAETQASPISGTNTVRAVLLASGASLITLVAVRQRRSLWPKRWSPDFWLMAMVLAGAISLASSSNLLVGSLKLGELFATAFLVTMSVRLAFGNSELLGRTSVFYAVFRAVYWLVTLRLGIYWIMAMLNPGDAFRPQSGFLGVQLGGMFYGGLHPNTSGQLAAFLVLTSAVILTRDGASRARMGLVLLFVGTALGAATLVLAQARTSLVATFVAGLVLLLIRRPRPLVVWAIGVVSILALSQSGVLIDYVLRGQDADLFLSLSGRTSYWQVAWEMALEKPGFGHGYYTGARFDLSERFGRFEVSTVDNTFLEVILTTGIAGLTALVMVWISFIPVLRAGGRSRNPDVKTAMEIALVTLIVLLFRAALGPSIQVIHPSHLLLVVPVSFYYMVSAGT